MNWKNSFNKRDIKEKEQSLHSINPEDEKAKGFIAIIMFHIFLGIFHFFGKAFNIEPLIYITRIRTRTSSSISTSFLPIILSVIAAYLVYLILEKSYMTVIINYGKKLGLKLQKYNKTYMIAKTVYDHPFKSYIVVTIVYGIIETFLVYVLDFKILH